MVIGGWTEPSDGRPSIGALHVGFYEGERLVYAGKVGSGFSERLLTDLLERLQVRRRESCPFEHVPAELQRGAHWVEPGLVAQVEFTQWTDEGRMRQPVFLGLRDDRDAGTSCASGRARSRAGVLTPWRPAGPGRRCASSPRAHAPRAATRWWTSSACASPIPTARPPFRRDRLHRRRGPPPRPRLRRRPPRRPLGPLPRLPPTRPRVAHARRRGRFVALPGVRGRLVSGGRRGPQGSWLPAGPSYGASSRAGRRDGRGRQ